MAMERDIHISRSSCQLTPFWRQGYSQMRAGSLFHRHFDDIHNSLKLYTHTYIYIIFIYLFIYIYGNRSKGPCKGI